MWVEQIQIASRQVRFKQERTEQGERTLYLVVGKARLIERVDYSPLHVAQEFLSPFVCR